MFKVSIALILSIFLTETVVASDTEVFLFRHAEKLNDGTKDPSLSDSGRKRAQLIAAAIKPKHPSHLHSTPLKRTRETLQPLAESLDLEIADYDYRHLKDFALWLLQTPGVHVVSGHSNTTPALVELLGGDAMGSIDESEYDRLYHLSIDEAGQVQSKLFYTKPRFSK